MVLIKEFTYSKWFEPRSTSSLSSVIVVSLVLKGTAGVSEVTFRQPER